MLLFTQKSRYFIIIHNKFTLQYVAIYTELTKTNQTLSKNLHYSMLLFTLTKAQRPYPAFTNLHYSMLLFTLKKALVGRLIKVSLHYSMLLFTQNHQDTKLLHA